MIIPLTKREEKNYCAIKDHILKEWGEKVGEAFEQKVTDFLDILEDFPEIGSIELVEKKIRGFQLTNRKEYFIVLKKIK